MWRILGLLLLPLLAAAAVAQEPPKPDAPTAPRSARQTWEDHFRQADTAHDGHLTRDEAKGGYAQVAKHFDDIDVDHKGYVTADDIRAWRIMRKATHRLARPPADKLKPQHAFQPHLPNLKPVQAGQRVALPADARAVAAASPTSPNDKLK
jgi:hypothetical protein